MKPTAYLRPGALTAPTDLIRPRRGARRRPVTPHEPSLLPPATEALPDLDPAWFAASPPTA